VTLGELGCNESELEIRFFDQQFPTLKPDLPVHPRVRRSVRHIHRYEIHVEDTRFRNGEILAEILQQTIRPTEPRLPSGPTSTNKAAPALVIPRLSAAVAETPLPQSSRRHLALRRRSRYPSSRSHPPRLPRSRLPLALLADKAVERTTSMTCMKARCSPCCYTGAEEVEDRRSYSGGSLEVGQRDSAGSPELPSPCI